MNCSPELIETFFDEELDAAQRSAVEQHLAGCPDCAETLHRLQEQRADIRDAATYFKAPAELRRAVRASLRPAWVQNIPWRSLAVAASVLLALSVSWNILQFRSRNSANGDLARTVVDNHVRSLLANHLVDIPSSDQHTVKPWFNGKLDFAPVVKDLADSGFPLIGGREEYLDGRRVAALVFHRRQHVINLFTWPVSEGASGAARLARDGYNALHWSAAGMVYWAVSDVSLAELEHFRDLYRN